MKKAFTGFARPRVVSISKGEAIRLKGALDRLANERWEPRHR